MTVDPDQSSQRRIANIEKDIKNGLKQLAGAIRTIRSGAPIFTRDEGIELVLPDRATSPAHAIVVLSEMYFGVDWNAVARAIAKES